MKNYQKLHYQHYFRMIPSGETVECTRQECFAPAEAPTADNPFIQRWYYSPDREMAIRLPQNAMGNDAHKVNAADLKSQERSQKKSGLCVAQTPLAACPMTCDNCRFKDSCNSESRAKNGADCERKCDFCTVGKSSFFEIDKQMPRTDDGEESGFDIEDDVDSTIDVLIKRETVTSIRIAVDALTPDERRLWDELLSDKTKAKIAEECGLSEGAIRKRVKKLAQTLRDNPALKNFLE